MVKEEAMAIKERPQDTSLDQFRGSDVWLDTWKSVCAINERRTVGEAGDVAEETITSWMDRIQESTVGYSSENIWNMDESGCFFKALPNKGLVEKGKEAKGSKRSKQRFTIFFFNAAGEKIDEPVVVWKSKNPRCFKLLGDKSQQADVHYFSNPKSCMTSDVMHAVLTRFNRKLLLEQRKVGLILDNATCHPKSIIDSFSQINIIFYLRTQLRDSNHLMLGLFKTLR